MTSEIHEPQPQYVEMFRRYQCRNCHSWIFYDEHVGRWWHKGRADGEMKRWTWDGSAWSYAHEN